MLTAVTHQMMKEVIQLSIADDAIELAELLEDVEEKKETEDKLVLFHGIEPENWEPEPEKSLVGNSLEPVPLNVYKKIPVPPPELV